MDDNKVNPTVKYIANIAIVPILLIIGLVGIYFKVEYSGWAIFLAVLATFG